MYVPGRQELARMCHMVHDSPSFAVFVSPQSCSGVKITNYVCRFSYSKNASQQYYLGIGKAKMDKTERPMYSEVRP